MIDIPIIVQLENVDISNGQSVVLQNIDFKLADGEMIYIIGKSGSGKSSLIKSLYGEIPLAQGNGTVAGISLNKLNRGSLPLFRRKLGMVFQEFHLLQHWTVRKNLEYVLKATEWKEKTKISERVYEVVDQVGLVSQIDKQINKLSGGEQQKIAIARSVLNYPSLILADEPTGNLDPESSNEIMYLLHKIAEKNKSAIIISTHDYNLIEKFPARIYECKDSQLLEKQTSEGQI